jgi:hypothetical protein
MGSAALALLIIPALLEKAGLKQVCLESAWAAFFFLRSFQESAPAGARILVIKYKTG